MSRVYFHSPRGTAHVSGAERANAGFMVDKIGLALLRAVDPYQGDVAWMGRCVEPSPEDLSDTRNLRHLATHLRFGGNVAFVASDGKRHDVWTVLLNTALRVGSRPMKFLARMHGQCEIHGWVEGTNRAWLADLIEQGRRDGLYRADMGWESVVALLRANGDEPVVMSYSVCMSFPNESVAGFDAPDGDEGQAWDALTNEERWHLGMKGLRAQGGGLELKPEGFDDYYFGSGANAFTIEALCAAPVAARS
jgi:hypothetical protein